MPDQDGLRFLFDIQDKITAKLAKLTPKIDAFAKKADKAFTKVSKAQEANSLKVAAIEQRRVAAAESNSTKLVSIQQKSIAGGERRDLVGNVLPQAAYRQWVLSFPWPLRVLFAARPQWLTRVVVSHAGLQITGIGRRRWFTGERSGAVR